MHFFVFKFFLIVSGRNRTLSEKFTKNFKHKKVYLNDEKHPILYYRCAILIIGRLHPMFTLRYRKSRDNLSSSDVLLSSRIMLGLF